MTNLKEILEHEINTERQLIETLDQIQDLDQESKQQIRSRVYDRWRDLIFHNELEK
jgi:nitrate reductase assembly molybdenum cofactor insertion protein NarJ